MTTAKNIQWYYYNPCFLQSNDHRVGADKVFFKEDILHPVDARTLLEDKVAQCLGVFKDERSMQSANLPEFYPWDLDTQLLIYYSQSDFVQYQSFLKRVQKRKLRILPALCLLSSHYEDEAHLYLKQLMERGRDLCNCAKALKFFLHDEANARQALDEAQKNAFMSADWYECADAWAAIFGDMEKARECLAMAERSESGETAWVLLAEAWMKMFAMPGSPLSTRFAARPTMTASYFSPIDWIILDSISKRSRS